MSKTMTFSCICGQTLTMRDTVMGRVALWSWMKQHQHSTLRKKT